MSTEKPAIVAQHQDVVLVRFCKTPDVPTVEMLMDRLREAHEAAGDRLVVIGTIASAVGHPPHAVRAVLPNHVHEVRQRVRSIHVVVEGRGVKATMQRTVLTALAALLPRTVSFHIHKTFADAVKHIDRETDATAAELTATAKAHGISRG